MARSLYLRTIWMACILLLAIAGLGGLAPHGYAKAEGGGPNAVGGVPRPRGSALNGVSCSGAKSCWAVGVYAKGKNQTLRWNGRKWTLVPAPNRNKRAHRGLNAVSCIRSADCWAVGGDGSGDEVLHWDGYQWSFVPTPALDDDNGSPKDSSLLSVDCTSATNCWAVGWQQDKVGASLTNMSDIMRWDGSSWFLVYAPLRAGSYLTGISCAGPSDCWAVGSHCCGGQGYNFNETLHWDGAVWTAVASGVSSHEHPLSGIACTSWKSCWAVGGSSANEALRWNGRKWSAVPVPSPGGGDGITGIASISCLSSRNCWAVGEYNKNNGPQSGAETLHWNGSRWALVRAPRTNISPLSGVSCVSRAKCWAVGSYNGNLNQVLRWNGSRWSRA